MKQDLYEPVPIHLMELLDLFLQFLKVKGSFLIVVTVLTGLQQPTLEYAQSQTENIVFEDVDILFGVALNLRHEFRGVVIPFVDAQGRRAGDTRVHNLDKSLSQANIGGGDTPVSGGLILQIVEGFEDAHQNVLELLGGEGVLVEDPGLDLLDEGVRGVLVVGDVGVHVGARVEVSISPVGTDEGEQVLVVQLLLLQERAAHGFEFVVGVDLDLLHEHHLVLLGVPQDGAAVPEGALAHLALRHEVLELDSVHKYSSQRYQLFRFPTHQMEPYWKARLSPTNSQQSSSISCTHSHHRTSSHIQANLEKARQKHSSIRENYGLGKKTKEEQVGAGKSKWAAAQRNGALEEFQQLCKEVQKHGDRILKTMASMLEKIN